MAVLWKKLHDVKRITVSVTISGKIEVRFPRGANAKTCFPSFTRLQMSFVLKTVFTFTLKSNCKNVMSIHDWCVDQNLCE